MRGPWFINLIAKRPVHEQLRCDLPLPDVYVSYTSLAHLRINVAKLKTPAASLPVPVLFRLKVMSLGILEFLSP
jgi:hypothetical protein